MSVLNGTRVADLPQLQMCDPTRCSAYSASAAAPAPPLAARTSRSGAAGTLVPLSAVLLPCPQRRATMVCNHWHFSRAHRPTENYGTPSFKRRRTSCLTHGQRSSFEVWF